MSSDAALTTQFGRATSPFEMDARRHLTRLATFAICCLPILTFTTPGRPSPSSLAFLDGLAMVKLVVLLVVFGIGLPLVLLTIREKSKRAVLLPLVPYYLFQVWAVTSVLWSPLPSVTIGQAGGLTALLVLASAVALTASGSADLERMLRTLSKTLFVFSLFVLAIHIVAPSYSGLDRRMLVAGNDGVVHPTAAGANSSLGLLLATICLFVFRYPWALRGAILAFAVHGAVLFFASSRTALGMALLLIPVIVFLYTTQRTRALMLVGAASVALCFVLFDPGFGSLLDSESVGAKYITRGQSADQIKAVSGRAEMWSKIWNEYEKSKIVGHGYFVTSEKGEIEVWYMMANHTAHNIYLQVLVSTGAIGLALFLTAILVPLKRFGTLFFGDSQARKVATMLTFVCIWYLGWSLLSTSFMGPVRSESVFFFTMLGIGAAQLIRSPAGSDVATAA